MLGLVIFLVGVLIAVFAPLIMTHDYAAMDVAARLQGPSAEHFFGTDELGRDLFSRVIYGSRYSLAIGVCAILLAAVIGVILGVIAGYFGGWVDNLIMRFLDVIQSIPALLLVIVIAAVLGTGFAMTVLALSVSYIPAIARLLRASILEVREQEYIEAAHSINCSKLQIIIQHRLQAVVFHPVFQFTVNNGLGVAALGFAVVGEPGFIQQIFVIATKALERVVRPLGHFFILRLLILEEKADVGIRKSVDAKLDFLADDLIAEIEKERVVAHTAQQTKQLLRGRVAKDEHRQETIRQRLHPGFHRVAGHLGAGR